MGALVVVAAFLFPIGLAYLARSEAFEDRMTAEFGEGSGVVVYVLLLFAGAFALIGAASLTNAGIGMLLAFGISTLLFRLWTLTEPKPRSGRRSSVGGGSSVGGDADD
jgi:hypothetical protein